ncbi:MAG: SDR family oxidoreductase [Hyphomicrobium denitrificans]|nr:SDR family oxidoreductase [Hyphomicrobium denitrificans]
MVRTLEGLVIAIPAAATATGSAIAGLIAAEQGELILGAQTTTQLKSVERSIRQGEISYPVQVDIEQAKSVDEFFKIAIAQFGRIDAIVLETKFPKRSTLIEKSIGSGVRRLLYCLDAALRYCSGDLHVVTISPGADRYAIPVANAFLGGRLATRKTAASPALTVRMSVISLADRANSENGTLARTVLHVLRETRNVDVTETVLWQQTEQQDKRSKRASARTKITLPM